MKADRLLEATPFREYAAEHLGWAETARSDRERETFEQMARAWFEASALWGRKATPTASPPPRGVLMKKEPLLKRPSGGLSFIE